MSTTHESLGGLEGLMTLRRSAGMLALDGASPVRLPAVQAPSLEGLAVEVPAPRPITEEELQERFDALCREHFPRRDRAPGEEVADGDDVLLDVLAYANGRLIPFSVRTDWWTEVWPEPFLPGFMEALVGAKVGLSVAVELTLPDTYVVESLRGVTARFLVDVKAAREVTPVDPLAPGFLDKLGLGATLDDVIDRLAEELVEVREAEVQRELQEHVLDALIERTEVELPASLIDEEIRHRWARDEYPLLVAKDFSAEELEESWQGWRADAMTRLEAEWRLRAALALGAIAVRDGILPKIEDVAELHDTLVEAAGVSLEDLQKAFDSTPAVAQRFENLVLHSAVLEHVLSKVELTLVS